MNEPFRQKAVIDYMVEHGTDQPYSTSKVAKGLGVTTNAVLKAFKRLRNNGRVFQWQGHWHMTSAERLKHAKDQVEYPDGSPNLDKIREQIADPELRREIPT